MKKLFSLLAIALFALTANAQSLIGEWIVDGDFNNAIKQTMKEASQEADVDLNLSLIFTENDVKLVNLINVGTEGTTISMAVRVPGTYVVDGDKVNCNFDAEKSDFDVLDIQSNSPEMAEVLSNPAMKPMILGMIKSQAKQEMTQMTQGVSMVATPFSEFTIKEITDTKLTIIAQGELEITFVKK